MESLLPIYCREFTAECLQLISPYTNSLRCSAVFMFKNMRKYRTIGLVDHIVKVWVMHLVIQYLLEVSALKTRLYHMGDRSGSS